MEHRRDASKECLDNRETTTCSTLQLRTRADDEEFWIAKRRRITLSVVGRGRRSDVSFPRVRQM